MECRENTELLPRYAAGELDAESRVRFERHTEACAPCRGAAERQRTLWEALDVWEAPAVSPDFDQRLALRIERDLLAPHLRGVVEGASSKICGFVETDTPNFSFRQPPCSFYSGTKALGEEAIGETGRCYVWRLRIPFDHLNNPRNYLSKVQNYPKVYDNINSLSHRFDFAAACLDLWALRAPFGIYNVTNPGFVVTRQVIGLIEKILKPARKFEFWPSDDEFYRVAAKTPRSNCVLDVSKLLATGVRLRPVEEALEDSLKNWVKG